MIVSDDDFYSHASCEARLDTAELIPFFYISTHTPLARRDRKDLKKYAGRVISTHTPLARRDLFFRLLVRPSRIFLLTRLLRGATFLFMIVKI